MTPAALADRTQRMENALAGIPVHPLRNSEGLPTSAHSNHKRSWAFLWAWDLFGQGPSSLLTARGFAISCSFPSSHPRVSRALP